MARYYWNKKTTVEECHVLGISDLRRIGVLRPASGTSYHPISWTTDKGEKKASITLWAEHDGERVARLRFSYTITDRDGGKQDMDYWVQLTSTRCNLGGVRDWFICPLTKGGRPCLRRVGKLYLPPGGRYFGCRNCYELTYRSCQEHDGRVSALLRDPERFNRMLNMMDGKMPIYFYRAAFKLEDDVA